MKNIIAILTFVVSLLALTVSAGLRVTINSGPSDVVVAGSRSQVACKIVLEADRDTTVVYLPFTLKTLNGFESSYLYNWRLFDENGVPVGAVRPGTLVFSGLSLTVPGGTTKTLSLMYSTYPEAHGDFLVVFMDPVECIDVESGEHFSATVPTSGIRVYTQILGTGSLVVNTAPTSPIMAVTGNGSVIYVMKVLGRFEPIELKTVAFDIYGVTNISSKITNLQLFLGDTQIGGSSSIIGGRDAGTVQFVLVSGVTVPRDSSIEIKLRANLGEELQTGQRLSVGPAQFPLSAPITGVGMESGVSLGTGGGGQEVTIQGLQGRIESIELFPPSSISMLFRFHPNHSYLLKWSENLTSWNSAELVFSSPTGQFNFIPGMQARRRFYRLELVQ